MEPGATQTLVLSFTPSRGSIVIILLIIKINLFLNWNLNVTKYQEYIQIQTPSTSLNLRLNGIGIQPSISLNLEGNTLDFGYSLAGERLERIIQVLFEKVIIPFFRN